MKFSYKVILPDAKIGVSDDNAGDKVMENLYNTYGDLPVEVYNRDELWGNTSNVRPIYKTTITKLYQ